MKKLRLALWLLSAPVFLFAQAPVTPVSLTDRSLDEFFFAGAAPRIEGRIHHATAGELAGLSLSFAVLNLTGPFQTRQDVDVKPDGTFSLQMDSRLPFRQVWLRLPDLVFTCLYITEGVFIDLDLALLKKKDVYLYGEGIAFTGPDAEACRVMNRHLLFCKAQAPDFDKELSTLKLGRGELSRLDSLFEAKMRTDQAFFEANGDGFRFLIENQTKSAYWESRMMMLNRRLFESKGEDSIPFDPEQVWAHPIYTLSNESRALLMYLYHHYLFSKRDDIPLMKDFKMQAGSISAYCPASYADLIQLQIENRDVKEQRMAYEAIGPGLKNKWSRALARSMAAHLTGLEAKITRIVDSSVVDAHADLGELKLDTPFKGLLIVSRSTSGEELLQRIRGKYAGRLVLIDLWATWCAPCIGEMPYSKKLHEETQRLGIPVEMVYLCTSSGSDEEKWTRKVVELGQPGTHVFVNDKQMNELFSLFNKSGYPSYVVIRPDGKIDTQSISRMSEVTPEMLKAML